MGDINGDGFDDFVAGSSFPAAIPLGWGPSYVVFGKASGFDAAFDLAQLDGTDGFVVDGLAISPSASVACAAAGDFNGDGFDDFIVGLSTASPNGKYAGSSFVVFGKSSGFDAKLDVAGLDETSGLRIDGADTFDGIGGTVAAAGDVNHDGFDDVIIGAMDSQSAYVVFGKASGFGDALNVADLDGSNGFQIDGSGVGLWGLGWSVQSAGDINADGFADVIVGAPTSQPNGNQSGSSIVVFGKASGFDPVIHAAAFDGSNGFRLDGKAERDMSRVSVSSAGDVNGDGFDDLIVGAPGTDVNGDNSGTVYVIFGKSSGFLATIDFDALDGDSGFRIDGGVGFAAGVSVSAAGDINQDGFDDIFIGAPFTGSNDERAGAAFLIYGHRALQSVDREGTAIGNRINGGVGADTVNGHGGNDTLIGWQGGDLMSGGWGRDLIRGGAGADTIAGGLGNDDIRGGQDADLLAGGAGSDRFTYWFTAQSGVLADTRDLITDFVHLEDRIDVHHIDAGAVSASDDAFTFIGTASFTAEGKIRAVQAGDFTILEFNTEGSDTAEMTIVLAGVTASILTAQDFIL
jgi:hypothetical protein